MLRLVGSPPLVRLLLGCWTPEDDDEDFNSTCNSNFFYHL